MSISLVEHYQLIILLNFLLPIIIDSYCDIKALLEELHQLTDLNFLVLWTLLLNLVFDGNKDDIFEEGGVVHEVADILLCMLVDWNVINLFGEAFQELVYF